MSENHFDLHKSHVIALDSLTTTKEVIRPNLAAFMAAQVKEILNATRGYTGDVRVHWQRQSEENRDEAKLDGDECDIFATPLSTAPDQDSIRTGVWSAVSKPTEGVGLQFSNSPLALMNTYYFNPSKRRLTFKVSLGTGDGRLFWPAWPPGGKRFRALRFRDWFTRQSTAIDWVLEDLSERGCEVLIGGAKGRNSRHKAKQWTDAFLHDLDGNEESGLFGVCLFRRSLDVDGADETVRVRVDDFAELLHEAFVIVALTRRDTLESLTR